MDTMVHSHHHGSSRYGLYSDYEYSPGLCDQVTGHCFFNARYLQNVSHVAGRGTLIEDWLTENGPEMMKFFFLKAFLVQRNHGNEVLTDSYSQLLWGNYFNLWAKG